MKMGNPNQENKPTDENDFYAILNVNKDATEDEIRVAYKRLCVVFHPDKHVLASDRKTAEISFERIRTAYNVLSNPESRAMYDVFGMKSLEMKMEVVPSRSHVKELRQEYEKMWKREKQLKKLYELAPSTNVRVGFDLSSQERRDPPLESHSILSQVALTQSKQYRLSQDVDVTTSLNVAAENGVGSVNFGLHLRKVFSDRFVFSTSFSISNISFHPLDNRSVSSPSSPCIYCTNPLEEFRDERTSYSNMAFVIPKMRPASAGFNLSIEHNLSSSLTQVVELGSFSLFNLRPTGIGYTLIYKTPKLQLASGFVLGKFNRVLNLQYRHFFGQSFELRTAVRCSSIEPLALTYGAMRYSTDKLSICGFELNVSSTSVFILIRYYLGKRKFVIPVTLSQSFSLPIVFYSTLLPLLVGVCWETILSQPLKWIKSRLDAGLEEDKNESDEKLLIERRRRFAEKETNLMRAQAARICEMEKKKNGLIIQRAWYGQFEESGNGGRGVEASEEDGGYPKLSPVCYSVATQLQICVNQSKLILNQGQSKSNLAGFYDPCPGQPKKLKIVYLFKCELHQATFNDFEAVRLPKMSHRVECPPTN